MDKFSKKFKWISFLFVSAIILLLLLLLFFSLDPDYRIIKPENACPYEGEYMYKYNETGECFRPMTRGPCHENFVFMPDEPNGIYGSCNCPYMFSNRSVLYHQGECYYIFTQAFCPEGHWLTVNQTAHLVCEENPCLQNSSTSEFDEWVPLKGGGCAVLGKTMEGCPNNAIVRFHKDYILPSCIAPAPLSIGAIGVRRHKCPLGSYRSIVGKCQPRLYFDFEFE